MDIDKQIEGTAFVTDVRSDFDLAMWNIEAAPKNTMLVMPQETWRGGGPSDSEKPPKMA